MANIKITEIKGTEVKGINFEPWGGFQGFLDATSSGGSSGGWRSQQLKRVVPWLAKATDMTANAVASLPFEIVNANGDVVDSSSDWKNKFGGLPSPDLLLHKLAASLCLGQAYLFPTFTKRLVVSLQYFAPQTITPSITVEGLQWFDRSTERGKVERYYPIDSEVEPPLMYFWLPDADVEIGPALSYPAGAALLSAKLLFSFDDTIQTYSERGFVPATLLSAKGMPGPAEREKAENWWNRFLRGWTKEAAKIVNAEAMTVNRIGSSMDELKGAYSEMTKQAIENIGTAFGIPAALFMSDMAFATEANAMIKVWYQTSVFVKIYNTIQNTFNDQLLERYGLKWVFRPETIDAFQEEESTRAAAFKVYVDAGIKKSIAAQMVGLELPSGIEYDDLDPKEPEVVEPVEENKEDKPVKGWVTIDGNHVFIEQDGDRPSWAGENSIEYSGYKLRNGRFLNKDKWAVDDGETTAPFEDSPEKAVSSYLEYVSINNELRITAENRNSAVSRIKDGSYTEKDLSVLSNGYGKLSEHSLIALARATGMRDKDARQFVSRLPNNASAGINSYGNEMYYIDVVAGLLSGKKSLSLTAAQIKELNLWRQIAERSDRKGKGRAADFKCKVVPAHVADEIRTKLQSGIDIAKAFEIGLDEGPETIGHYDNEGLKALAEAINRAVEQPEVKSPAFNISMSPINLTAQMPQPDQPSIVINVPEQQAPVVNVTSPEVKVTNEVNPTPVTIENTVNVPDNNKKLKVIRDNKGTITGMEQK